VIDGSMASLAAPPLEPKQERSAATRRRILDAAVQVLTEQGHAGLTTSAVAERARITRGAQQHHFPRRDMLLAATVRHLSERHLEQLRSQVAAVPHGRARITRALDVVYEQYGGPLFTATLELALAAQHDPALRPLVAEHERMINREMNEAAAHLFAPDAATNPEFPALWSLALATARGVALLRVLEHPPAAVDKQWRAAKARLTQLLAP
jgi:AcrR family transcriptional regulator